MFVPTGYVGSPNALPHDRLYALLVRARAGRHPLPASPAPRLVRATLDRAEHVLRDEGPAAALDLLLYSLPAQALQRIADALEDLAGPAAPPDDGARVMSADELHACAEGGIQLGAHTVGHVVLTRESSTRVRRELGRPREDLEAIAGAPCRSFAWCNGRWSPPLLVALRDAGYSVAVTTCDRPNIAGASVEPLLLGRKVIHEGHLRDPLGRYSPSLAAAHLHDLFGAFGLTRPVDGQDIGAARASGEEPRWQRSA